MIFILLKMEKKKSQPRQITDYLAGKIDDLSGGTGECSLRSQWERVELLPAQHLTAEGLEGASAVVKIVYLVVSALIFCLCTSERGSLANDEPLAFTKYWSLYNIFLIEA